MTEIKRCPWCAGDDLYTAYHDSEWGVPVRDSLKLFELFILDGAQAGLSWITILKRREGYRAAFNNMNPELMALWSEDYMQELAQDSRIIRNRLKIKSAKNNAQCFLKMSGCGIDFSDWLWNFMPDNKPIKNHFSKIGDVPASTPLSETISKELKKKGWTFVGPTIVYAVMQAAGLVNDHFTDCFRYNEC
ncbi:MAG: DNA-3-methyladenine glycosylase I [Termitinemataceae bacterium]|nr:MAG: DNA-3-methyladenine glycosylase I [Termitinemataceae bacterium]